MATRTKPLVTAATLASAAAIAVASPAIAPSLNLPTPHALSAAKVQLATFADVLTVPSVEWTDLLFGNTTWGGVISGTNYGADYAKPQNQFGQVGYVNPWATFCDGGCDRSGPTGAAYLFFDALVNGNGKGYDDSANWSTGVVNYFFEPNSVIPLGGGSSPYLQFNSEGFSAATWYALQGALYSISPALSQSLTVPIAAAYFGPHNLTVFYNLGLTIAAALLQQVPVVGPFTGNSILAYLGDLAIPGTTPAQYYQYGLSGAINYWTDIITGSVPFPTTSTPAAATLAAATSAAPAVVAATVTAPETPAVVSDAKPAADAPESTSAADAKAAESTPAADTKAPVAVTSVSESTPAVEAPESTPAAEAPESTPAAEAPESTPEVEAPEVKVADSTPAVAETKPVEAPEVSVPDVKEVSVPDVKDVTPAADVAASTPAKAKAPAVKHPVRDAVEKVSKQISSALNGAKAAKAAKAGSADSAS